MNKLSGKTILITGANQGFGLEAAKALAAEGANIIMCARDLSKLAEAAAEVEDGKAETSKIIFMKADISKMADLEKVMKYALDEFGQVDVLLANAGVYGPKGPIETVDWSQWCSAVDINLNGTILSCISVLPHMKSRKSGKIIILSGGGATKPMPNLSAYAVSKAGIVRFAETLAMETQPFNIDVNSIAPGALNTRLLDEILEAGPEKVGKAFFEQSLKQKETGGSSMSKGAALCVFLASDESNGITGRLISAIWDPWDNFAALKNEITDTDIYTLRRIVPEERGKNWSK